MLAERVGREPPHRPGALPRTTSPIRTMSITMFVLGCGTMGVAVLSGPSPVRARLSRATAFADDRRAVYSGVLQSLEDPAPRHLASASGTSTPIVLEDGDGAPKLERFIATVGR